MKLPVLLIFTKHNTNRVRYIFRLMLEDYLSIPVAFTDSPTEFLSFEGPKLSYGIPFDNVPYFAAADLLFESGLSMKRIQCFDFEGEKAFFPIYDKQSAWPFDPFSAAFYLVSRYEEYLPHLCDQHSRFKASESDSYKCGFLDRPLVNIWALRIRNVLLKVYPALEYKEPKFSFVATIDVDSAYAYRHKGLTRQMAGLVRSLWDRNYFEFNQQMKVLMNRMDDPYDTFDFHLSLQKKYSLNTIYFILLADYDTYDKNIPVNKKEFQALIRHLADYSEVGIHPSYASNSNPLQLELEISRLAKILGREVTLSRQHFLKIEFPVTYRNLINKDILEDYSLGYHDYPGFRAGICTPFMFYDLDLEVETNFRLHPVLAMDGTLNNYLNLSPSQALRTLGRLINTTKEVNGEFICIWHNSSLSNSEEWWGWAEVYERMIKLCVSSD